MRRQAVALVAVLLVMTGRLTSDQDLVAAARDLYASAAYEDALAVLNGLPDSKRPAEETRAIEQYRALCLLALGRSTEAERAIEAVVAGEPMYRPAAEVSPRLRAAFSDVRRRVLPSVLQQQYARAKAEYDAKEFAAAVADFTKVIEVMSDPDLTTLISQPPLSDLRTLVTGFKDLATIAATPPPAPPPPAPVEPPAPKVPKVYTSEDGDVVPPIVLRQELPPFPGTVPPVVHQGLIEVTIDETGIVESAYLRIPITASYDSIALAAARTWRYRPAMANGIPVKYRKAVQITLKPR